jgi:hypothetical protein
MHSLKNKKNQKNENSMGKIPQTTDLNVGQVHFLASRLLICDQKSPRE